MSALLVNTCTRPVELHLGSGVVVIPAMSQIDCSPEDLELAQVRVLTQRGVLVAHSERPPVGESGPAKKVATTRKAPARKAGSATRSASSRQSSTRPRNS